VLTPGDQNLARLVNAAAYDERAEDRIVAGSPHLKYASLRALYQGLVDEIVAGSNERLSVLELGAGDGLATTPWFRSKARVTAVDCSEQMLARLATRARDYGAEVTTVLSDADEFIVTATQQYDAVCFVSMLHHIPDYLALLRDALKVVRPGGSFLTFQDPLRYDTMSSVHHRVDRLTYFAWRLGQGNLKRGIQTRLRRFRGVYSPEHVVDFEEYHVVRNGVDSDAIVRELTPAFANVRTITYWSSLGSPWQTAGERLGLRNAFGILASGRLAGH
jgi:SAM-dependent methyltransferase